MKNYLIVIAIFLAGALLLQVVPYISKGESIEWDVVLGRFLIVVLLTVLFWLFQFGGIRFIKELIQEKRKIKKGKKNKSKRGLKVKGDRFIL